MPEASEEESRDTTEGEQTRFYESLSPEEKILITLRDELYSGSWEGVVADLKARLEGKPYIFQLATRIEEDIARIEKLRKYEREHGVNLGAIADAKK